MALKVLKFRNIEEANHMLNGGIMGGEIVAGGVPELVGKTITFTAPAGSKTFTQPTGTYQGMLRFNDIKSQLEGAIANLRVSLINGKIAFRHASNTLVSLGAVDEAARVPLGLPNNKAVAGVAYAGPGGSSPKVNSFFVQDDTIYCLTE